MSEQAEQANPDLNKSNENVAVQEQANAVPPETEENNIPVENNVPAENTTTESNNEDNSVNETNNEQDANPNNEGENDKPASEEEEANKATDETVENTEGSEEKTEANEATESKVEEKTEAPVENPKVPEENIKKISFSIPKDCVLTETEELLVAKTFLMQNSVKSNINTYDHMSQIIMSILDSKIENAVGMKI